MESTIFDLVFQVTYRCSCEVDVGQYYVFERSVWERFDHSNDKQGIIRYTMSVCRIK